MQQWLQWPIGGWTCWTRRFASSISNVQRLVPMRLHLLSGWLRGPERLASRGTWTCLLAALWASGISIKQVRPIRRFIRLNRHLAQGLCHTMPCRKGHC